MVVSGWFCPASQQGPNEGDTAFAGICYGILAESQKKRRQGPDPSGYFILSTISSSPRCSERRSNVPSTMLTNPSGLSEQKTSR